MTPQDLTTAAAPSLEVERAVRMLKQSAAAVEYVAMRCDESGLLASSLSYRELADQLVALAARLPALEAENRQLATDLAAAHAAVDRGVVRIKELEAENRAMRALEGFGYL